MANYRTAIIACGTIARVHARGWGDVEGQPTAIGAIADTHPDARREFGEFFGVPEDHRGRDEVRLHTQGIAEGGDRTHQVALGHVRAAALVV